MAPNDTRWLSAALNGWEYTRELLLKLPVGRRPLIILFDRRCLFRVDAASNLPVAGREHRGSVELPGGRTLKTVAIAFTSPGLGDSTAFLAMALPDVWRTDPRYVGSIENWEQYLTGAFIHEMTHVRMLDAVLPRLRVLQQRTHPDSLQDDVVQDRFGRDTAFAAAVGRETDLLFRASNMGNRNNQETLVREVLASIQARRERYYVGDLALWGELEQTFLDLEGVAQWAAFTYARHTALRSRTLRDALAIFRSGDEYWSQLEGLALFLALDALVPDWQARVFSSRAVSAVELLQQAVSP